MPAPPPPPGFIPLRDRKTLRLVCHFNPQTGEIVVVQRGDVRIGTLPMIEKRIAPQDDGERAS